MAPRKGTPVRAPPLQPEASSRPSSKPEIQQESKELDARIPDSYLEPINVQVLSPRVAEPDNPDGPPPFDWDKRLDDKRQYERQRYLKHHFPHHRLSHDIFDTLMLDTAHDPSLGHRSVPMELADGYEANNINGENVISSDIHIAIVSQQPGLGEKKTKADGDAEIETQTFFGSSASSSLTHQSPSAAKYDTPSQHHMTSCTVNSTCSSKSTKTPIEIHPVPDQIIFQHPHDKSLTHSTYSTHSLHANNTKANTAPKDTTQLASLALFICIICFFICGWQACTSWRELRHRRRHRRHRQRLLTLSRHTHGGRGRHRQQQNMHRTRNSNSGSSDMFMDDPETALSGSGGGMVEMADLAPFADSVVVGEEMGIRKEMPEDGYRDFPIESPLERKGEDV